MQPISPLVKKYNLIDLWRVPNGNYFIGVTTKGVSVRCRAQHTIVDVMGIYCCDCKAIIVEPEYSDETIVGARSIGARRTGRLAKLIRRAMGEKSWYASELAYAAIKMATDEQPQDTRKLVAMKPLVLWSIDKVEEPYSPYNTINS